MCMRYSLLLYLYPYPGKYFYILYMDCTCLVLDDFLGSITKLKVITTKFNILPVEIEFMGKITIILSNHWR